MTKRYTLQEAHQFMYCNRGMRRWAARYGLDFDSFRRHGITREELLGTGDAMAKKFVDFCDNKNG